MDVSRVDSLELKKISGEFLQCFEIDYCHELFSELLHLDKDLTIIVIHNRYLSIPHFAL